MLLMPSLRIKVYITTQWRDRISTLPTHTQKVLRKLEDEKAYDSAMYVVCVTNENDRERWCLIA